MTTVNRKFKELRGILQLTQLEFAKQLKITQANVSQIETGESLSSSDLLLRIGVLFPKLDYNWLMRGDGMPFATKKEPSNDRELLEMCEETVLRIGKYLKSKERIKDEVLTKKK